MIRAEKLRDKDFDELSKTYTIDSTLDLKKPDDEIPISALPHIHEKAFFGILKEFVDAATNNSEASPVAIAANVIVWFCAMLDRTVYQWIGDSKIHCRPFFLLVGKSGKARKGTSESLPRRVFARVEELRKKKNPNHTSLNIHGGGLSSGEGICFAIRDTAEDDKNDNGISDKRLLVIEPEFSNVLANCKRETSTLSPVIRNVFDGRDLAPLTKNNRTRATKPHVVIIGHITSHELTDKVHRSIETTNGLLNRFLICFVAREKLVPLPAMTSHECIKELSEKIVSIFEFIDNKNLDGQGVEITLSNSAQEYWKIIYPKLSQDNAGIIGSLLARSEVYARMLAMVFTIFDKKTTIEISHLESAVRWIAYIEESIKHLFRNTNDQVKESEISNFSEEIFLLLKKNGSMTRTEINKAFNGHKSGQAIKEALERLLNQSPACITQTFEKTFGRSKEIFSAK